MPGLAALLAIPLLTYAVCPPTLRASGAAQAAARSELAAMGPLTRDEVIVTGAMLMTVSLWVAGQALGISSVAAALAGLSVLLATGVLTWRGCLSHGAAWDTMWWFAIIISLATQLRELGVIGYLAREVRIGSSLVEDEDIDFFLPWRRQSA